MIVDGSSCVPVAWYFLPGQYQYLVRSIRLKTQRQRQRQTTQNPLNDTDVSATAVIRIHYCTSQSHGSTCVQVASLSA